MAWYTIIVLQGGSCTIIHPPKKMFIPENSANISSLLNHIKTQVNTLSDPTQA